ncbi:MAG: DUF3097 domain-containing protein [Actinomycetota bacterium]|nr:DUF3097 domain-containing protein [Actinomycetota bacterium]
MPHSVVAYDRDILDDFADRRRAPTFPVVEAAMGMVVEHRASGYCGDVVRWTSEALTLRDRRGQQRHFGWQAGGFLLEGRPITLQRPVSRREAGPTDRLTASGSIAGASQPARVAVGSRIWVEGRHDAELLELVWGDELREAGIVVEPLHGIDDLAGAVGSFAPTSKRRLGVLVDHLVAGSKEQRIAARVTDPNVLVTGHPFVDVWAGIRPNVVGIAAWPDVPRGVPWKEGMCAALGTDLATFWPRIRNQVKSYADLRPELVGAVEQLLDFVAG